MSHPVSAHGCLEQPYCSGVLCAPGPTAGQPGSALPRGLPAGLPSRAPAAPPAWRVLCFGNELHGDDGFGPAVCRRLADAPLPAPWAVHDVGSRGLDALALLQDCGSALLVDAAAPAGQPGRLGQPALADIAVEHSPVGHGMGLGFTLRALQALGEPLPPLRLLTAEMAEVCGFRPGLSPAMAAAVDEAVAMLRRWAQEQVPRTEPCRPGPAAGAGAGPERGGTRAA